MFLISTNQITLAIFVLGISLVALIIIALMEPVRELRRNTPRGAPYFVEPIHRVLDNLSAEEFEVREDLFLKEVSIWAMNNISFDSVHLMQHLHLIEILKQIYVQPNNDPDIKLNLSVIQIQRDVREYLRVKVSNPTLRHRLDSVLEELLNFIENSEFYSNYGSVDAVRVYHSLTTAVKLLESAIRDK